MVSAVHMFPTALLLDMWQIIINKNLHFFNFVGDNNKKEALAHNMDSRR